MKRAAPENPGERKRICLEEDDDDRKPPAVVVTPLSSTSSDDDDDDVVQIAEPPPSLVAKMPSKESEIDHDIDEEEIQLIGSTGQNALADFPHAREHCVVCPFRNGPEVFCPNCYCYVCDKEAKSCDDWADHCHAVSSDSKWKAARAQKQGEHASASTITYVPLWRRASAKELLEGVTRVYPEEVTPPAPLFVTELKHYQKQSLAFMLHVERNEATQSGWLCDEVGMGKSAVVIALVAANPLPVDQHPTLEAVKDARRVKGLLDVRATVLLTSISLMGQWQDEFQKHAPELKVYRHHPPSGYKLKMADLFDADVVISTATVKLSDCFTTNYQFRRVVLDEAHLLGTSSLRLSLADRFISQRHWCVTATPFLSSSRELHHQCEFLSLPQSVAYTAASLKQHMIRHTKAQRINGAEALALPESTTTIKLLTMSQFEQEKYDDAEYFFHPDSSRRIGYVQLSWYTPLAASLISNDSTKIKALTAELTALLEQDPNMRACIFTQFRNQLKCVRHAVKQEFRHVKVYQFHGGTDVKNREKHIRDFQSLAHPGPAVFLITYRAGSVGVTLTAATHVFLMEPCILPSAEVQAAGRIHRLGQTKPVGVTKFIYKDSCESSIMDLHKKIKQGDEEYIVGDELTR